MTEGSIFRHLVRFSTPLLLASCLQALYTTVDTLVVGRFVGTAGLSAVSNCGEIVMFYTMTAMGLSSAGQIIIAQFVGRDDRAAISGTIGSLFSFLTLISVLCSVISIVFVRGELRLLRLPQEAMSDGVRYTVICSVGFVFTFLYNAIASVLRGMGDSKHPMIFVAIASLANLVLDFVFVAFFGWGAAGAAVATTFSQALSVLFSLVYLYRRREAFGFDFRPASFRIRWKYLSPLLRLGVPMAVQFSFIIFSMMFIMAGVNSFGVAASAANGVANKIENIVRIAPSSIGTAGSAMVAQNIAAKKEKRVISALGYTALLCVSWGLLCGIVLYALPERLFALFDTNPEIQVYARIYAPAGFLCFVSNGARAAANALINGIGFASLSLAVGLLDGVFCRIGFSVLFANLLGMGIFGYWLGNALAGYVPVVIGGIYFLTGKWKTHRLLTENVEGD